MLEGGGSLLLATTGRFIGPGGQEAVKTSKGDWLAYHYYDGDARRRIQASVFAHHLERGRLAGARAAAAVAPERGSRSIFSGRTPLASTHASCENLAHANPPHQ